MDPAIEHLPSTTFGGKRLTRKQIALIQDTVKVFPALSRRELAHTLCEQLNWFTENGRNKIQSCLNALAELEKHGIITLPALVESQKRGSQRAITWTANTDQHAPLNSPLKQLVSIHLQVVTDKEDITLWNEFVDRYHYLGYRRPIGCHLRYFIVDLQGRKLGCLLFSFATQVLPCRDQWLGWDRHARQKRLNLVVNNTRFLLFPWVNVKYLASKSLSLACQQLPHDWHAQHGYRPVLLETFVDTCRYSGISYRAANWQLIGNTAGVKSSARVKGKSQKAVYLYPLSKEFRAVLVDGKTTAPRKRKKPMKTQPPKLGAEDPFIQLWGKIIGTVVAVANQFDREWQKRQRVLTTLLLVLFIFRLVFSKNKQGYGTTVVELWDQCRLMNLPLPQEKPVAASAFCNARKKLDENLFKTLNTEILNTYDTQRDNNDWKNHRLFAVDGSKINVPRELANKKYAYKIPAENAHYPQGLLSCLYRLKPKLPVDFDLTAHSGERELARRHLHALRANDVVVYDRGYFSYALLYYHIQRGIHPLFRLQAHLYTEINQFTASNETDKIIEINPSAKRRWAILKDHPDIDITPLKLRLIKYSVAGEVYTLGTTLYDKDIYHLDDFPDVYHARWGVEELYKISKQHIEVEEFHSKSERGVKQELFAHFVLITMTRIFSNHAEIGFNQERDAADEKQNIAANFKNSLITVARNLEALFLQHANVVKKTVNRIINAISICKQKRRPHRSYERVSKKPVGKWSPEKGANTKAKKSVTVITA